VSTKTNIPVGKEEVISFKKKRKKSSSPPWHRAGYDGEGVSQIWGKASSRFQSQIGSPAACAYEGVVS